MILLNDHSIARANVLRSFHDSKDISGLYLGITLMSGPMPTQADLDVVTTNAMFNSTSGFLDIYKLQAALNSADVNFPPQPKRERLAQYFGKVNSFFKREGDKLTLDWSRLTQEFSIEKAGTVGWVMIFSYNSTSVANNKLSPGLMLGTVGAKDSGSDMEMPVLDLTLDMSLKPNTIEVNITEI